MATNDIFSKSLKKLLLAIGNENTPCGDAPELYDETYGHPIAVREAKNLCTFCHVREQCLETALIDNEPFGIWGGLTPDERRRLKKRR